jgi:MOSC domain-containing protein YiiM
MAGRVEAIWLKRAVRGPMDATVEARLVAGEGIDGDANFGRSKRQVTIIEREVFDRIRESLPDADPSMRRANFMVSGLRLEGTRDLVLTLGAVRVRIHGETRPCERMDAQCPGLTAALDPAWGGGVYGVVLDDGPVRVGDVATLGLGAAERPFAAGESAG